MRHLAAALAPRACSSALVLLSFFALAPHSSAQSLDGRLRQLETEIAAVRGLSFKSPVEAKVIKRPADDKAARQGYYVPREKMLYLYDDVAGNYEKGVLIHEMVHALQDQHFDLEKLQVSLHQEDPENDRAMALAALVEGDATFTMIEVLKKEQPRVAGMLDVPLDKARNLRNAFLYAQGARYVKALKDKGGWSSVNAAYRFPPRSTASILNLGGVSVVNLGPGRTRGPLDLLEKLLENPDSRHAAMKAALAWRGDSVQETPEGTATILAAKDAEHATVLADALRKVHAAPAQVVVLRPTRVHVYEPRTAGGMKGLRDAIEGPLKVTVFSRKAGAPVSFGAMIDELLGADIVCLGEDHDSDVDHRLQLQIIKALHAHDERLAVGLEMFQKPFQPALDRFVAGGIPESDFLKESQYLQRWGYDWSLYRPIVEFCRMNRLPAIALNAPRELTRRISQVGMAALNEEEKKELGAIDLHVEDHRLHWYELLPKMHGNTRATAEQKERSYQVMATWDDFMARTAVEFQHKRKVRRLVILAGSGHIERGFGIPGRVARYSGGTVLTIGISRGAGEVLTDYQIRYP